MENAPVSIIVLVIIMIMLLSMAVKVLTSNERIILYTFGKYQGLRGPGIIIIIPFIQTIRKIDMRKLIDVGGIVDEECTPHQKGIGYVAGAYWDAVSAFGALEVGDDIRVTGLKNQLLVVVKVNMMTE